MNSSAPWPARALGISMTLEETLQSLIKMNFEWKALIDDAKSRYKKTKLGIKREKEIGKILERITHSFARCLSRSWDICLTLPLVASEDLENISRIHPLVSS